MTTSIARQGHTAATGSAFRAGAQRFTRSLASVGAIVLDAVEATRALGSAHTAADRRAVLERFAADTTRDAA